MLQTTKRLLLGLTLVLAVLLLGAWAMRFQGGPGAIFVSKSDIERLQARRGRVLVGRFEATYPCVVTRIEQGRNELQFESRDFGRQSYQGFEGYTLYLIRARCLDGKEAGFVFRSGQKS